MKYFHIVLVSSLLIISCNSSKKVPQPKPQDTEVWSPIPPTVIPSKNNAAPSDAIVLFDGNNLNEWVSSKDKKEATWTINSDGSMTVRPKTGSILTKKEFGSIQLHLEWKSPSTIKGDGQGRGNSGVFLQNRYEVQILDNNNNQTYSNGQVGSIYKQSVPLAKASSLTGEWNSYDIIYHAPEFDSKGLKTKSATITVIHNGILVQDHFEIQGTTEYIGAPKNVAHAKGPIQLQDHGDEVSYRNIWVREL